MSEILGAAAVDRLLSDTRAALERMTNPGQSSEQPVPFAAATERAETVGPAPTATGADSTDRVVATVAAPGRITSLTIDPRVLRGGSAAVGDAVTEAVNAALTNLQEAALAALPTIDTVSLAADLERVQAESLSSATTMFAALEDAMRGIERRGRDTA